MRKRLLGLLAVPTLVLAACGGDDDSAADPDSTRQPTSESAPEAVEAKPDGTVRLAYDLVGAAAGGFKIDPRSGISSATELGVQHWIYGALMRPTPDGELVPGLAERATVVDDTTIEIVLRDDLTFSDGSPLTAKTVKTVLEHNLSDPSLAFLDDGFFSLKSVAVNDPTTLTLSIPDGTAGSWYSSFIGDSETLIIPPDATFDPPTGAGPYQVVEHVPRESMVLEKNPNYWNADEMQIGRIELINAQATTQAPANALQAGQVDWANVDINEISTVEGAGAEVVTTPTPDNEVQFLVCKSAEPFDDVRVRQALSMAIDREAISDAIFGGDALPVWDLWPEGHRFHNPELTGRYAYDPEAARELLAEAGHPDGFSFDMIPLPGSPISEIAQIAQQQWGEIGVEMNIVQSTNFVQDALIAKQAPMALIRGHSPGYLGKFDNLIGGGAGNLCGNKDADIAKGFEKLRTAQASSDQAVEYWHEVQETIVDKAVNIWVVFRPTVTAYDSAKLGGYELMPHIIPVPDLWQLFVKA